MRSSLLVITLVSAIYAQAPPNPEEVLAKARDKVLERTERLPNYICVQTVNRKYFKRANPAFPLPSCDDLAAKKAGKANALELEGTDRLRLDVKVSGGTEIGAWAGSRHFDDGNVMKLIRGPFGTGGFGTFLTDIFSGFGVEFYFDGEESRDGLQLFRYRFEVAREASHYMVHAGGDWIYTAYDGAVWIDPRSFELRQLRVRTATLPEETGACESTTTAEYATARIGSGEFLLPQRSGLHFLMRDMTESDVATTYSSCHQYHAESALISGPSEISADLPPAHAPIPIPAGLAVELELLQPIDTDTAAAGDTILAKVSAAVRDPTAKTVVIPAHSVVHCQIFGMEHRFNSRPRFIITIGLETVDIQGISTPLYATELHGKEGQAVQGMIGRGQPSALPASGQSRFASSFYQYTNHEHYVMPRGYKMGWITVPPPESGPQLR